MVPAEQMILMADPSVRLLLRRLRLHSEVGHDDAAALSGLPWQISNRARHAYIVREGDVLQECAVLLSGVAQRQKDTNDGRRQIVGFSFPGDPLDFEQVYVGEADCSVQMTTAGAIARVSLQDLRALLRERPGLTRAIMAALLADAASYREWILNVGRRDARQRIAHLLCEIALRSHAEGERSVRFAFPFTQEQIADATGITTVHVNRTLRQLSLERLIVRDGGTIEVPDLRALRQTAGFDARYLHLRNAE